MKSQLNLDNLRKLSDPKCMAAFIRGFGDGDGSVICRFDSKRHQLSSWVLFTQKSFEMLDVLKDMLSKLGIKSAIKPVKILSNLTGRVHQLYFLKIESTASLLRYYYLIGFNLSRKMKRLHEILMYRLLKSPKYRYLPSDYHRALELKSKGFSASKISMKLGIPLSTVQAWVYRGLKPYSVREGLDEDLARRFIAENSS